MSIESWTNMKQNRAYKMLFIFLLGSSFTLAEPVQAIAQNTSACDPKCGCDGLYIYDSVRGDCVVDLAKLIKRTIVYYDNNNDAAIPAQEEMARSIYTEGQKLFQGIMISVVLFITCASICVLSACIYCCKINYSDRKLKREVEAMAKKLHKTSILKKEPKKPKVQEPIAQSCNVVVEEAGLFVV